MTHAFFKAPKTLDELLAGRDAIAEWARLTYGWIGRSPDYKAAFLATLGANADFYDPYQENAQALVQVQPGARALHQSRHHPSAGRPRPAAERGGATSAAHVEKETDAGIVVSGAKVVATGSVLTNYTFVAHHGLIPLQDKKFAVRLHGADQRAGREVHLPHLLRDDGDGDGQPVRLSAVEPARRERRRVHHGQGAGALGERLRLRRHREGQQLLPAHRLPAALRRARLHAACGEARLHRRPAAQGGRRRPAPRTIAACRPTSAR